MTRLFHPSATGLSGYLALALFATAYLAAMGLVLAPGTFVDTGTNANEVASYSR